MLATPDASELPRVERVKRRQLRPAERLAADPSAPAEEHDLDRRGDKDPAPGPPVAEAPVELRDVPEVLAVEPDDEGGEEEHGGDDSEHLHCLVLVFGELQLR